MRDDLLRYYRSLAEDFEALDARTLARCPQDMPAFSRARRAEAQALIERGMKMRDRAHQLFARQQDAAFADVIEGIEKKLHALVVAETLITELMETGGQRVLQKIADALQLFHDEEYHFAVNRLQRHVAWQRRLVPQVDDIAATGVAAILRVRNELRHLQVNLNMILAYFDEVVVIDHASTDGTGTFVASLNNPKIKLFRYDTPTARAGDFYGLELREGKGSLASYYNDCFSRASCAYVCKWDADMYPLPALQAALNLARTGQPDIICFNGLDCLGLTSTSIEPRLFRSNAGFRYIDAETFESFEGSQRKACLVKEPLYLHAKLAV